MDRLTIASAIGLLVSVVLAALAAHGFGLF
jgi:hypothetical protein